MELKEALKFFEDRVSVTPSGCWNWLGTKNESGYGGLWNPFTKKCQKAHRVTYEFVKGPIATGLTIDHLCRNKSCVNPEHLEAVTLKENIRRSGSLTAVHSQKTHCIHGHPFSGSNLKFGKTDGKRICITCERERGKCKRNRKK